MMRFAAVTLAITMAMTQHVYASGLEGFRGQSTKERLELQRLRDDIAKGRRAKSLDLRQQQRLPTGRPPSEALLENKRESLFSTRSAADKNFNARVIHHQRAIDPAAFESDAPEQVISYDDYLDMGGYRERFIAWQKQQLADNPQGQTNYEYYKGAERPGGEGGRTDEVTDAHFRD